MKKKSRKKIENTESIEIFADDEFVTSKQLPPVPPPSPEPDNWKAWLAMHLAAAVAFYHHPRDKTIRDAEGNPPDPEKPAKWSRNFWRIEASRKFGIEITDGDVMGRSLIRPHSRYK